MIPELTERYIDFIGFYENVFPQGFCRHVIQQYEIIFENGFCGTRKRNEKCQKTQKDGSFYFLNMKNGYDVMMEEYNGLSVIDILRNGLQRCFDAYVNEFDILQGSILRGSDIKIQKTFPGEGYHVWHCEQSNSEPNRCLVWAIYLNDIDEAGETEFLYQKLRIVPKENAAVIWPACYTHTHRGNVVHGEKSKYIVTGWFNLE